MVIFFLKFILYLIPGRDCQQFFSSLSKDIDFLARNLEEISILCHWFDIKISWNDLVITSADMTKSQFFVSHYDWINVIEWCLQLHFYLRKRKGHRNIWKTGGQLPPPLHPRFQWPWSKCLFFCLKFILYSIPGRGFNTIFKLLSNDINLLTAVLDEISILCQPRSNQCNQVILIFTVTFWNTRP